VAAFVKRYIFKYFIPIIAIAAATAQSTYTTMVDPSNASGFHL
jgi:hypothetical protein